MDTELLSAIVGAMFIGEYRERIVAPLLKHSLGHETTR